MSTGVGVFVIGIEKFQFSFGGRVGHSCECG
jgi:hypothetical protein